MLVPRPGQHVRHVVAAEIDAAARPADALDAGDHALAARTVLQEDPQLRLDALAGCASITLKPWM